jgi:hypothetical protein
MALIQAPAMGIELSIPERNATYSTGLSVRVH